MKKITAIAAVAAAALTAGSAQAATYSNPATITINDAVGTTPAQATPSPSQIVVSGAQGPLTSFSVSLNTILHNAQKDIDVFLTGPAGQSMTLVSDVGYYNDFGVNPSASLTLSETASTGISAGSDKGGDTPFSNGTFLPTDNENVNLDHTDCIPDQTAGGIAGNTTSFDHFKGTNPNGVWNLYVWDDCDTVAGTIGGWSLTFPDPPAAPVTQAPIQPPVTVPKTCPKGKKLKKGKCVKKKRKKKRKPKK